MHWVLPAPPLNALVPQALHPIVTTVASPPYPAEHSHRPVSEFISALLPQTQEPESVALEIPPAIEDPEGQDVQPVFPSSTLNALVPHGLQPTLNEAASPPYPGEHSHRSTSKFNTALPPQTQESELVAVVSPPEI